MGSPGTHPPTPSTWQRATGPDVGGARERAGCHSALVCHWLFRVRKGRLGRGRRGSVPVPSTGRDLFLSEGGRGGGWRPVSHAGTQARGRRGGWATLTSWPGSGPCHPAPTQSPLLKHTPPGTASLKGEGGQTGNTRQQSPDQGYSKRLHTPRPAPLGASWSAHWQEAGVRSQGEHHARPRGAAPMTGTHLALSLPEARLSRALRKALPLTRTHSRQLSKACDSQGQRTQ